jgi:hypothetical protein
MADASRNSDRPPHDEVQLGDLRARPASPAGTTADTDGGSSVSPRPSPETGDDDIIAIEDLTPRTNIKGGRKIILGEILPLPE